MSSRTKIGIIIGIFVAGILSAGIWFLAFTSSGATFSAAVIAASLPAGTVTVSGIEGCLAGGTVLRNIELSDIEAFPGAVLRAQEVRVSVRYPWDLTVRVKNGRFILPTGEVVSFAGTLESGKIRCNVYSGLLYAQTLSRLFGIAAAVVPGRLTSVDLYLSNTTDNILITGTMLVETLSFRNFTAHDFPLKADLSVRPRGRQVKVYGKICADKGVLSSRYARMDVTEAACDFSGDPLDPRFKVRGSALVADTRINAVFGGTVAKPEIQLSSQPPLAQDRLMVMLLTGQSWQGTVNALSQGRVTPGLIKDFADFFLFGGSVDNLEKKLGITDFALTYQRGEKGFEVHKALNRSADVIYGMSRSDGSVSESGKQQTQTVGLEYKVTDAVSLEGRRQLVEKSAGLHGEFSREGLIRLKFKKRF